MEIKSKFLGEQSVDPSTIITFPKGLPGFEADTRFKFFHQEGSDIVFWLQSLDNDDLLFSVAQPAHFNINYSFTLTNEEEAILDAEDSSDLIFMIMLHKTDGEADKPTIKGSIKSPLVINSKSRKGIQKTLVQVEQSITLTETSNEIEVTES